MATRKTNRSHSDAVTVQTLVPQIVNSGAAVSPSVVPAAALTDTPSSPQLIPSTKKTKTSGDDHSGLDLLSSGNSIVAPTVNVDILISPEVTEGVTAGAAAAAAMIDVKALSSSTKTKTVNAEIPTFAAVSAGAAAAAAMNAVKAEQGSTPSLHCPSSPSQRDAFLASLHVQKVSTNLSAIQAVPGSRLNFEGTVVVVYPCETNPARRYVLFADEHGVLGITFWNENVSKFNSSIVGTVAQVSKVLLTLHQGRKGLTMSKESGLVLTNQISPFWTQLARNPATCIADIHAMPVNSFVNVVGVRGYLHSEKKLVKNVEKDLVIIRLVDRTGQIEVQSWTSKVSDFETFRDRPVRFQRVRISAFSGTKCLEILDGNGTLVSGNFEGSVDLAEFWNEPVSR